MAILAKQMCEQCPHSRREGFYYNENGPDYQKTFELKNNNRGLYCKMAELKYPYKRPLIDKVFTVSRDGKKIKWHDKFEVPEKCPYYLEQLLVRDG